MPMSAPNVWKRGWCNKNSHYERMGTSFKRKGQQMDKEFFFFSEKKCHCVFIISCSLGYSRASTLEVEPHRETISSRPMCPVVMGPRWNKPSLETVWGSSIMRLNMSIRGLGCSKLKNACELEIKHTMRHTLLSFPYTLFYSSSVNALWTFPSQYICSSCFLNQNFYLSP